MKQGIHPEYFETKVRCACGAEVETRTTLKDLHVEICSQCHPFFTGKQARIVDSEGRVERFVKKFEGKSARVSKRKRRQETAASKRLEDVKKEKERAIKDLEKKKLNSEKNTVQENKSEEEVTSTQ